MKYIAKETLVSFLLGGVVGLVAFAAVFSIFFIITLFQ